MSSFTDQLRDKAAQCREWAKASHDGADQSCLLVMAGVYDELVINIEHIDDQETAGKVGMMPRQKRRP